MTVRPLRKPVKNANVFVDVDLTLVDASGKLRDGAREGLQRLKDEGCHLFLWSTVGLEYARTVAARHQLTDLFESYAAKQTSSLTTCLRRRLHRSLSTCRST